MPVSLGSLATSEFERRIVEEPFEKMIEVLTLRWEEMAQPEEMEYEERCLACLLTEMIERNGASVVMATEGTSVRSLEIS